MFDIIDGFAIDPMHAVFHGVFRDLLQRIVRSLKATTVAELNYRLLNVKPPQEVSRLLRPLAEFTRGNWRVSELRTVAYLAPLLLRGMLPLPQYDNLVLFCTAAYYLHRTAISSEDLRKCHRQLQRFCRQLLSVYKDKSIYTFNVHLLLHLADRVKLAGPLYTHSCDEFEMLFAKMLAVQHGRRGAAEQILRYLNIRSTLQTVSLESSVTDKPLADFVGRVMCPYFTSNITVVNSNTTLLGSSTMKHINGLPSTLSADERELVPCFSKCLYDGHLYKVYEACKETKRVDCYLYVRNKFYVLQYIVLKESNDVVFVCNRLRVCRLSSLINTAKLELRYPLCKVLQVLPTFTYVPLKQVLDKCCSVLMHREHFLLPLPTLLHRS